MQFPQPRQRPRRDSVLPMINVVFLLLIFFLMTARIVPAPPFDLTPPETGTEPATEDRSARTLWLGPDGAMVHGEAHGDAALDILAADDGPVLIRADQGVAAADLARLMRELGARGLDEMGLVTTASGQP
ncbi:MAG: biopolymer transport protein ExbD [Rhodobacteraceae bacterium HLUCCA12]|nr:MAG: biopolymer transport protein ExbD [Rhodobacteraceae bacterium HLUCCA12]